MKQFAILGLGYFGKTVLNELLDFGADVLVMDRDREVIDSCKDLPVNAIVMDVINQENITRALPKGLDGVVIDLGDNMEASLLATSYCRKLGIERIFVKALTEGHAEILELVGATKIIFPNQEAAKRITPLLVSTGMLNYLPVSGNLVIAEIEVPVRLFGLSLIEANMRQTYGVNLISVKNGEEEEYGLFTPEYRFRPGDIALVSGTEQAIQSLADPSKRKARSAEGTKSLGRLFGKGRSKAQ